jgi:hypothetical protein
MLQRQLMSALSVGGFTSCLQRQRDCVTVT